MAQKKAYSRYFIILQQDENGYSLASDKLPSGYTKLETKNDKCKISYYVQNLKKEHEPYYMALICNKKDAKKLIKLGMMNIDDYGRAEITHEYSVDNVAGSNISIDMVTGAAIVKFVDTNIISVMSGFSTTDIPSDWKGFKVIEVTRQLEESNESVSEEKAEPKDVKKEKAEVIAEVIKEESREERREEKNIFEEYEKKIEEVKETAPVEESREKIAEEKLEEENKISTKEESDEERVEESTEENRIEAVEETAQRLEGIADNIEEPAERVEENFENIEEPIKVEETLEERAEIKEQEEEEFKAEENIQSNIIDSDEVRDKHKCKHEDKDKHKDHKCKHEDEDEDKHGDHICKHEDKDEHDDHKCKHEEKSEYYDHKCDHYCHKDYYGEYKQEYDPEHDCPKGTLGDFFKGIAEEFEEVKDACKEIKKCKWYKVTVKNLDELCNQTNYNKYTVVYYPMISYYPYIKNHGYYLLGYKYDSSGKMKYLVYGIPGKKRKSEQPYGGKSGFVTWVPAKPGEEREDDMGHWLMFYDFRTSTIVIPMK